MITPRELALINRLIYYDPPRHTIKRVGCCMTAGMMARELLARPPDCAELSKYDVDSLNYIQTNRAIGGMRITRYINHNDTSGFVAFALEGDDVVVLAFRGSETASGCAQSNIDWADNILAPFDRSIQYADVERFIDHYPAGNVISTGHSKGGHNAMYSIAVSQNESARAVAFDAQGFSSGQLTSAQKRRLHNRAINYVYRRDVVGALLCHPEKRVFAKGSSQVNAHSLDAFAFDMNGEVIPAVQSLIPYLIGQATCALNLPLPALGTRAAAVE